MPSASAAEAASGDGLPTTRPTAAGARAGLALLVMAASGFAGLGYQIVWTQQAALWMGHDGAAALAVVTAFFGGLSLGALTLGRRIERSAVPARWYAGCEMLMGAWGLLLVPCMAPASEFVLRLVGAEPTPLWQWAVTFGATFLMLLPATAAMGATLPAMQRVLSRVQPAADSVAALYAANTFGAVAGVLAVTFWLVPAFGLAAAALCSAALNGLCALLVRALASPAAAPAPVVQAPPAAGAARLLWTLAACGLLGIGYEVLVLRVLSQVSENTVFTLALLLAVYLVGTALGAAGHARIAGAADGARVRDRLLLALAGSVLLGTASLWGAELQKAAVMQALGGGYAAAVAAEASLALVAFGLPTIVMGALFSHLCVQARACGLGLSKALGVNTAAASLAPLLFGLLLLPAVGPRAGLLCVCLLYLGLATPRAWRQPPAWALVAGVAALALLAPPLVFVDVPEGGRVLSHRDGTMAAVSVVEDAEGSAVLRINNRQQEGSSSTVQADARQALLPLLLHPAPRRALFLGLGTGITASAAAQDRSLHVDAVELLPEVVEASTYFVQAAGEVRPQVHVADARRFVRNAGPAYDLVIADNFHPARSGSAALYTVEHFRAVRARLAPGGLFCQWLPLHQLDAATLRSIVRSFVEVYPDAHALLATNSLQTPVLGLVARPGAAPFDGAALRSRLARHGLPREPASFGLGDPFSLLGSFVAGPASLARFAAGAPLNTDDHAVVAYLAPRITYAPDSTPAERLLDLLAAWRVDAAALVDAAADPVFAARLDAYIAARNRFLEVGQHVRASPDPGRMLAQVREPLLALLQRSPDFRPAYDPLLNLATALQGSEPTRARALLQELQRLVPDRPEAAIALRQAP